VTRGDQHAVTPVGDDDAIDLGDAVDQPLGDLTERE
jgi:hypothetical protein